MASKIITKCLPLTRPRGTQAWSARHAGMLANSCNHIIDKSVYDRYDRLPLPKNKILATYCWIDGSLVNMRSKDRILRCAPSSPDELPTWTYDGSSTGQATTEQSDTYLKPVAMYKDPFRGDPHILVLCDTYGPNGKPLHTNNRSYCYKLCEMYKGEEPWFGLEQEYVLLDVDGWGLGWPKGGGYPAMKYEFSYCGTGAQYIAGRQVSDAHARACLYAGLAYEGSNAEVMYAQWEYQIGVAPGIKAADDLWMSRYILSRVAEDYGVVISLHPKPMGPDHPGSGMHHNFSTRKMRAEGGLNLIDECIERLKKNHNEHMKHYSVNELGNRMRMTGQFETALYDKFTVGEGNRGASIRLRQTTKQDRNGYLEDRRPGADCDPYKVCALLLETCLSQPGTDNRTMVKYENKVKNEDPCKQIKQKTVKLEPIKPQLTKSK